jgi:hypothetical protein
VVVLEIAGWVGTAALVCAYVAVSFGRIKVGLRYQLLNGVGAIGLIINGAFHGAWPSVALNVVWLAAATVAIVQLRRRRTVDADEEPSHA